MRYQPYGHTTNRSFLGLLVGLLWQRVAGHLPQWVAGHFDARRRQLVARVAARVLLLVGLVVQCVLLLVTCYLIDLGISLMELWAELARKHLELTV